jgi:hypothetical protein
MSRFRLTRTSWLPVLVSAFAVLALVLVGLTAYAADAQPDPKAVARVVQVQNRHTTRLLKTQGVLGTATALDSKGRIAIKVYVDKTKNVAGIPNTIEGLPVIVQKSAKFVAQAGGRVRGSGQTQPRIEPPGGTSPVVPDVNTDARFTRPVPIGVCISPDNAPFIGTLGCRVKDSSGRVCLLSNNHVIAGTNYYPAGTTIYQPWWPVDTTGIARLQTYVRIRMNAASLSNPNRVDAAIARLTGNTVGNTTPADGYGGYTRGTSSPYLGMPVQKYGRTTNLTLGQVTGVNMSCLVAYSDTEVAYFTGQIEIMSDGGTTHFGDHGDSGSLVVTKTVGIGPRIRPGVGGQHLERPVALLFAGTDDPPYITNASPIDEVTRALSITIDGQ